MRVLNQFVKRIVALVNQGIDLFDLAVLSLNVELDVLLLALQLHNLFIELDVLLLALQLHNLFIELEDLHALRHDLLVNLVSAIAQLLYQPFELVEIYFVYHY